MTEQTYTERSIKHLTMKSKDGGLYATDGTVCYAPGDVLALLEVGDEYGLEVKGFNTVSGFYINDEWYHRKSDQEIVAERAKLLAGLKSKHIALVEKYRADWTAREANLPDWAKSLMEEARLSHTLKGTDFETEYMGWGYTLVAVELTVLFVEHMSEELKESRRLPHGDAWALAVQEFDKNQGLSGNQLDWAWMIARQHVSKA